MIKEICDFRISGIYCIYNRLDGKRYIGSSNNMLRRLRTHFSALKSNRHHNSHLQRSWNFHGEEAFCVLLLEKVDHEEVLLDIEQIYIDNLFCLDRRFGYNISPKARGTEISQETRLKMSEAGKGKTFSKDQIEKIRNSNLKHHEHTRPNLEKGIGLYLSGTPVKKLCKQLGISDERLYKELRLRNIPKRGNRFCNFKGKNNPNYKDGRYAH